MKGGDLPRPMEITGPTPANGEHKGSKKGASSKRAAAAATPKEVAPPEPLAGPIPTIDARAIDAPMWPLHSAVWFQPVVAPSAPAWSSLAIEHHNRMPAPDFLPSVVTPADLPHELDKPCHERKPSVAPKPPAGDLEPLGWDPRAFCRKEKAE